MVTETENTRRVDRVIEEAFNEGELDVIDEVISSKYELHGGGIPQEFEGPDGFKELVRMWRSAFPDLQMTVEDRVVEAGKIADQVTLRGTHEGEFMGIEPTGTEVETTFMAIHHVEDGKGVADYVVTDMLGLLEQLGVVDLPTK